MKQRRSRADLRQRADQRGELAGVVFARREALNLRQDELADLAGCSTRFIHDLESGKTTVQLAKVLEVLEVLGLRFLVVEGHGQVGLDVALRRDLGMLDDLDSGPRP